MKRGDIVIAAAPGDFTSKPRPYVVVQSEASLSAASTVTLCPLTTELLDAGFVRIRLDPSEATGLKQVSDVAIDQITTLRQSRIDEIIGSTPDNLMARIDAALRRWLDL